MSAAAILKLQASGFTADQVSALAELIDTQAATKADLEAVEHRLEIKIDSVEHRLQIKIDSVEHRLEIKIADIRADVTVLQWMMGFVLAFQVAIFAKLFLH
jgi:hypothetical protein